MDVITDYELKKYCHSVEQMLFYSTVVSGQKNSIQNTKCKKEYVKPKVVNGDMGRRTKMITEYRQTGRDVNGDNTVGIGWGWVQNILPCHPLSLIYHGLCSQSGADRAAWLPSTCQVGRLVRRPGRPPRQMLK